MGPLLESLPRAGWGAVSGSSCSGLEMQPKENCVQSRRYVQTSEPPVSQGTLDAMQPNLSLLMYRNGLHYNDLPPLEE